MGPLQRALRAWGLLCGAAFAVLLLALFCASHGASVTTLLEEGPTRTLACSLTGPFDASFLVAPEDAGSLVSEGAVTVLFRPGCPDCEAVEHLFPTAGALWVSTRSPAGAALTASVGATEVPAYLTRATDGSIASITLDAALSMAAEKSEGGNPCRM
jgi:hypothetical protein